MNTGQWAAVIVIVVVAAALVLLLAPWHERRPDQYPALVNPPRSCHGWVYQNEHSKRWDASCNCGWSNGWWSTWQTAHLVLEGHLTRTREYVPEEVRVDRFMLEFDHAKAREWLNYGPPSSLGYPPPERFATKWGTKEQFDRAVAVWAGRQPFPPLPPGLPPGHHTVQQIGSQWFLDGKHLGYNPPSEEVLRG